MAGTADVDCSLPSGFKVAAPVGAKCALWAVRIVWLDGRLVVDHPNLRFRTVDTIKSRYVTLSTYSSRTDANKVLWYDDIVVATEYIGPIAEEPPRFLTLYPAGPGDLVLHWSGEAAQRYTLESTVNLQAGFPVQLRTSLTSSLPFNVLTTRMDNARGYLRLRRE